MFKIDDDLIVFAVASVMSSYMLLRQVVRVLGTILHIAEAEIIVDSL